MKTESIHSKVTNSIQHAIEELVTIVKKDNQFRKQGITLKRFKTTWFHMSRNYNYTEKYKN